LVFFNTYPVTRRPLPQHSLFQLFGKMILTPSQDTICDHHKSDVTRSPATSGSTRNMVSNGVTVPGSSFHLPPPPLPVRRRNAYVQKASITLEREWNPRGDVQHIFTQKMIQSKQQYSYKMRNKTPPLKRSSRVIFFFQNIIKYPSIFLLQDCCCIVIHLSSHLRDGSARLALIGAAALLVPICSVSTPLLYCVKSFIVLTFSLLHAFQLLDLLKYRPTVRATLSSLLLAAVTALMLLICGWCYCWVVNCWLLVAAATVIFFISLIGDYVGDDLWVCMDVLVDGADYWPLAAAAFWRGQTAP
jgi:hypothetical protein